VSWLAKGVKMSDDEKHSSLELETELLYDDDTCDDKDIFLGDSHVRGSGMVGSVSNLVNTIIGSGILALPSSAAGVGWALAVAMMAVSALLTLWSLVYLSKCAGKMGGDKTSFGKSHLSLIENLIRCESPIATVTQLQGIQFHRGPSHRCGSGQDLPVDDHGRRLLCLRDIIWHLRRLCDHPRRVCYCTHMAP
jgi:hypothetical protein